MVKKQKKKGSRLNLWQERARLEDIECEKCGHKGRATVDHIIPVGLVTQLGLKENVYEDDWNFQYLCRACNTLKAWRLDYTDTRTLVNLRRYIELAEQTYSLYGKTKENGSYL